MRRFFLIFCIFIMAVGSLQAQRGRKIKYRADMGYYDQNVYGGAQRLIGNVVFAQDNVLGYCDSAYLYENDNYIIAFGDRVKIIVGDSVHLYGRRVYYDGNEKFAAIADRVRLEKGTAFLLTDSLTYNTSTEVAYYVTGGKLINEEDTMTSREGLYFTKTDDAYASKDVLLWNKTYTMDCQELRYNAAEKMAYFISRTHLYSDDQEIFTSSGWYDTEREITLLTRDVQFYSESRSMFADSVFYDRSQKCGKGWCNAVVVDTVENYVIKGNYLEYQEGGGISIATDSNLLILIDDNRDSLFLHSDTLMVFLDDNHEIQWARAYNHVKFYRKDMQGACDSVAVTREDSTLLMFYNPVVWSESYQMTADTIRCVAVDSNNVCVYLIQSGFLVGGLYDDTEFDQIKGNDITGFIRDKKLFRVDVVGNAECVYYLQEEDSTLIGINTSITSEMRVFLKDNKIDQIRFYDAPEGHIFPDEQFEDKDRKLTDFRWLIEYRPSTVSELYRMPIPRQK